MLPDNEYMVDALNATPSVLAKLVRGCTEDQASIAPTDEWSIRQAVCHMRDNEERALERMRLMRDQSNPFIASFDQEEWARERNYGSDDLEKAFGAFREFREQHIRELRALAPHEWDKSGQHAERGTTNIQIQTLRLLCHDAIHAAQIVMLLPA